MRTIKNRIKGLREKIGLILSSASSSSGSNESIRPSFYDELFDRALKASSSSTSSLEETLYKFSETAKGNKIMLNEMKMAKGQGEMEVNENGVKRESNKGRGAFYLFPYEALEELAKWYEAGAEKYGERNWEKGISVKDCMNRMARHSAKACSGWMDEGPFAHLVAVIWNAMAAITGIKRNPYTNDFFRDEYLNILGLMKISQEKSSSGEKDTCIDTLAFDHAPSHTKDDFPIYIHNKNGILTDKATFSVDIIDHQLVLKCDFENEEDLKEFQANLARAGIKGRESEIISEHEQPAEPKLEIFQKPMNVGFYGKKRKSLIILNNVSQEESKIMMSDFKELFDSSFPMSMIYFPLARNLELEFDCPKKKDFDNIIELIQSQYSVNPDEPD